ncbi:Rossmann-like domain-containing protein [Maridesulfovibrio bastinii]|uniref:Rossmann-like domain-containing protein n=1 Tax=Maridesulfovibrio bastinii TaxID=47157 RepID=UPI000416DBB8|nr:DUF364 domain-containing protein [Maridesulfovibrio bastinii]
MSETLNKVQAEAAKIWKSGGLLDQQIKVKARVLSIEEAIGNPEGDDFPLQKGKERLMEADFCGCKGQAFTDMFGDFSGTIGEISKMDLENNFRRAIFISSLNATMRYLGKTDRTIHCKDKEPTICAGKLPQYIRDNYGDVKITQVGYQPKMVEALSSEFQYRVLDLDPDNIGQKKFNAVIEGSETSQEALEWADIILSTGTVIVNDTLEDFLREKPVIFYGTTIAGAASIMGWKRYCDQSL